MRTHEAVTNVQESEYKKSHSFSEISQRQDVSVWLFSKNNAYSLLSSPDSDSTGKRLSKSVIIGQVTI